ncbi:MAG TPA: hypothetical protein VND64_06710 [Pirellulales bacterium]|nr:hypothetical protein [Pirellulales bacterium]
MSNDRSDAANEEPDQAAATNDSYRVTPRAALDAHGPADLTKPGLSANEIKWVKETLWPSDESEQRFSLTGMFGIVTAAAVVLAVGIRLPRPVFAGLTGFATLAGMAVLSLMNSPPFALRIAWWVLLGIYLLAMGAAIWG